MEQFREFYRADLLPRLEQLEGQRKQVAARVTQVGIICAVIVVALVGGGLAMRLHPAILIIAGILVVGIFFWRYTVLYGKYLAEFKGSIIRQIVSFVDPGLSYERTGCISEGEYMGSRIFLKEPDRYRGEDLVFGTIGKTEMRFSEVHSEYKTTTTDSKGRRQTHWHTIFKGIFFVADFNKHFNGLTVVLPDVAENLLGRLGQMFQSWNIAREGDLVRLEDPVFEKRFVVYSTDQIEARYLLSTALMSRIVEYMDRTGCQVYLSFARSSIHVAIPYWRDLFEPRLFKTVLDPQLAEGYLRDLLLVTSIIDELDLNTRIWTKA